MLDIHAPQEEICKYVDCIDEIASALKNSAHNAANQYEIASDIIVCSIHHNCADLMCGVWNRIEIISDETSDVAPKVYEILSILFAATERKDLQKDINSGFIRWYNDMPYALFAFCKLNISFQCLLHAY